MKAGGQLKEKQYNIPCIYSMGQQAMPDCGEVKVAAGCK